MGRIRTSHENLLEAEVRLVEANSDVEALKERNKGIEQQLEEERRLSGQAERDSKEVREKAAKAFEVVKVLMAEAEETGAQEYFTTLSQDLTVDGLETEIKAEQSKLEFIHAGNPNAIRDFEKRQTEIDRLNERIRDTEKKLDRLNQHIRNIRGKWEPELDKLIAEISDAFSYNFQQIGCAGEISVHKDDDFDLWAIQIKVKFR